jgi:hypothetical protein
VRLGNDEINLNDVYYVPGLETNLISVSQLIDKRNTVTFNKGRAIIQNDVGGRLELKNTNGMFILEQCEYGHFAHQQIGVGIKELHEKLGHMDINAIRVLVRQGQLNCRLVDDKNFQCSNCIQGKLTITDVPKSRKPMPKRLGI